MTNQHFEIVELDLAISSEEAIRQAHTIFAPDEVKKKGKYAADPVTFISLISSITFADVAKEVIVGLIATAIIEGAKK
jgi:hypothetical protein